MSGLLNSTLNGSSSNLPESTGRSFPTAFSAQSGTASGFSPSGSMQGLHNVHGNFNIANLSGTLASRNTVMSGLPSSGIQQPGGSISSGRFTSNNLPGPAAQISHGHSGIANRGAINVVGNLAFNSGMNGVGSSVPGISSSSSSVGNRSSVPGLGVSPLLGNFGPRVASSLDNIVGGGNIGRNISSGGLFIPALASRVNQANNSGSGSLNVQGSNRLMSGMLQQAPQMIGMLGNSYSTSGGSLSQNQVQTGNNSISSMGMLNDLNLNDSNPFDLNDFPQLTGRPGSAGGAQGQMGSLRKQGVGVSSIVQQSQEFSIQNEDFPALPGFKGGNTDFSMDLHQKDLLHENAMVQSQQFPMARSAGFSLGGNYLPNRHQQQQLATAVTSAGVSFASGSNQDLLHLHGSDLFPTSHGAYHSQNGGPPSIGLRPLNSPNPSAVGAYEQFLQQYKSTQNQAQLRLQQMPAAVQSYRDQNVKSMQGMQTTPDRFGVLGLLRVLTSRDPDLTPLTMGIDLTTLGLKLSSQDTLYKKFSSPWSDEPTKGEPEYSIPACYCAKQLPPLQQVHFSRFQTETLFYIFYSMPRDEAQLYAANELYARGWFYHREHRVWFTKVEDVESLVKTRTYERGSYHFFDPNKWEAVRKDNVVIHYEAVEKRPALPPMRPQYQTKA